MHQLLITRFSQYTKQYIGLPPIKYGRRVVMTGHVMFDFENYRVRLVDIRLLKFEYGLPFVNWIGISIFNFRQICLFDLTLYVQVNDFPVMSRRVFLC